MESFELPIEQLTEADQRFEYAASPGWWAERACESPEAVSIATQPFRFALGARRVREDVLLAGSLEGAVQLECGRCTRRYSHELREEFRLLLEPVGDHEPEDPEGARSLEERGICLGEDLEAGWFRGPKVRLDEFFGELIALALPIQPLCSEDCPGICPHCGVDRAETQCQCVDEKIDSPFAVLADWKGAED